MPRNSSRPKTFLVTLFHDFLLSLWSSIKVIATMTSFPPSTTIGTRQQLQPEFEPAMAIAKNTPMDSCDPSNQQALSSSSSKDEDENNGDQRDEQERKQYQQLKQEREHMLLLLVCCRN